ncbi:MAG: hypothetical protein R3246_17020, partial [Acidimicrobiia bacterium]|nr:hypothetical protein [Acidimicrobiia bacterium]
MLLEERTLVGVGEVDHVTSHRRCLSAPLTHILGRPTAYRSTKQPVDGSPELHQDLGRRDSVRLGRRAGHVLG